MKCAHCIAARARPSALFDLLCCRDLISMKQRGDKQGGGGEQLQANAIVQAYCSTLDAYINAQVVGCTQHGTCVVTLLGVTETLEVEVSSVGVASALLVWSCGCVQARDALSAGAVTAPRRSRRPCRADIRLQMRRSVSRNRSILTVCP